MFILQTFKFNSSVEYANIIRKHQPSMWFRLVDPTQIDPSLITVDLDKVDFLASKQDLINEHSAEWH